MKFPEIQGMKVDRLIGQGESGLVYAAVASDGSEVALKVFDGMSISRRALQTSATRLANGGWPRGVMRLVEFDYDHRPAYHATATLVDDGGEGGGGIPRSLQYQIDSHPGPETAAIVRGLADALSAMHCKRVAHANLKPGNVFLSDTGEVLLSDWALGNMPGVGHMRFTDALLYQPPAQLRSPEEYLHEEGYRWDVYAFGTLAYRLLTGRFPRCHDVFASVAPAQGVTRRDDINADLGKIAETLEQQSEITWPDEPADEMEAGVREWISRCLELDPQARPASMIDVAAGLARVEQDVETHRAHLKLLDDRRRANRRALHMSGWFALALVGAIGLGVMWQTRENDLREVRETNERNVARLTHEVEAAEAAARDAAAAKRAAEEQAAEITEAKEQELRHTMAMLQAARELGDQLFGWAIEHDARQLPPLDGRAERLRMLEASYEAFLAGAAETPGLDREIARARLHLVEIALAGGDPARARTRLNDAAAHMPAPDDDPATAVRMARNLVLLGLLQAEHGDESASETLQQAREKIEGLADGARRRHLAAVVDILLASHAMEDGDSEASIEVLVNAARVLNELADARPDASVLRLEIARAHLAAAAIHDGDARGEEAMAARDLAIAGLRGLHEENPGDTTLMLELAGSVGTMAEVAVMAGDIEAAGKQSEEAARLLAAVMDADPENPTARSRMAAQLGLQAGILRDRGEADAAIAKYREGKTLLESARESTPDDRVAAYRLALVKWELGRMLGIQGARDEEIALLGEAADLLGEAGDLPPGASAPHPDQVRLSSAYLHGDLGHALEQKRQKPAAKQAFEAALVLWTALVDAHPEREEFADGLAWCRRRLAEIRD